MSEPAPSAARHTNRLIHETSPYLLQHAHNPVDWYPWGAEALTRAKVENKPILLSIGYSACHWCHVMERESFENETVAALMNRSFVNIKVDREERPDLDDIYMAATLALNGQGGWPMTVFLTPDQRPFFAGTYFPPEDRFGRPGFSTLLIQIADLWERRPADLMGQAETLTKHLRTTSAPAAAGNVGEEEIRAAVRELAASFDPTYGGFGPAPKFPPATQLRLLFRHHRRTGDPAALTMATKTLDGMAQGGMYDQIGGGFARYSTDERWLVPHFEKMLYDNALLASAYSEGFQVTGNGFYQRIAREILEYVLREMTGPDGAFYSATDADSEGEEGKFYVWTPVEVEAVLGPEEGGRLCAYYDISDEGNWEGKSIPHTPRSVERVASRLGIAADALSRSLEVGRAALYEARRRRVAPGLDDKVLTAWNGMMLGAMAEGARVLSEPRYLHAAARAADFLLGALRRSDGRLLRTYRRGKAHLDAYLEDYAFLAEGLVDLYEAGGDTRYLREAARLAEGMVAHFGDEGGAFFDTANDHEALILRHKDGADGAVPSANAVAASALTRLAAHLDRSDLRERAVAAIQAYAQPMSQHPRAFCKSLSVVDFLLEGPVELAFVGTPGGGAYDALWAAVGRRYLPNRIVAHHDPGSGKAPDLPLLRGKGLVAGKAALYVCRNFACRAPLTDPADLDDALADRPRESIQGGRTGIAARREGRATPDATAARAARFLAQGLAHGYGRLGTTGLTVSRLGFGCYRVDDETPAHREALTQALLGGCTLIDTSTNYMDGASERLVGSVLAALAREDRLRREEVVVVSKIGYVQGQNLILAKEREAAGKPFPDMVKYLDGCWHCIHPDFLQDQLTRSLDRLQLATLDVCLLHNPEYFFSEAKRRLGTNLDELRDRFYRRLTEAFAFLEREVAAGRIAWYGVSSNTAVSPADDFEATSVTRMLEAARAAGGPDHHLRVLQVPLNLFESGAVRRAGGANANGAVLAIATEAGLGMLTNRPLNAQAGEGMIRLADVSATDAPSNQSPDEALARVGALEDEFRSTIGSRLRVPDGAPPAADWFRWADQLRALSGRVEGLDHWRQIEEHMISPSVAQFVQMLDHSLTGPIQETWRAWLEQYLPALDVLLAAFHTRAAGQSQARSNRVTAALNPHLPVARRGEPLSRKALWVLVSTPGVSTVLLGMRHPDYVSDGLEVLKWAPLGNVRAIYDAMSEVRAV
jgi:uncharacterized protein YyaL (SSP411 family)/aryl-alcohol dehydrogenase-like predicted oxidoreductase